MFGVERPSLVSVLLLELGIEMTPRDLTLVFTTIERTESAVRFLLSIRQHMPDIKVLVLQQGRHKGLTQACRKAGATLLTAPYDLGVSAARNRLLAAVDTPYFLLAEDDMVLTAPLPVERCMQLMEARPEIIGVTGTLRDVSIESGADIHIEKSRHFTIALDQTGGGILMIPATLGDPPSFNFEDMQFQYVDYGPNWGVFSMNFFQKNKFGWDERFKTGGEHLDFFLRVKLEHPQCRIVACRSLLCNHVETANHHYSELRSRRDWVDLFREKWKFNYFCQVGGAFRRYASYHQGDVSLPDRRGMLLEKERERAARFKDQLLHLRTRYDELKNRAFGDQKRRGD